MTTSRSDHDLLIKISTDVGYIKTLLDDHTQSIKNLTTENQDRKDWQEAADTRIKAYMGFATAIGAVIYFMIDNVWRWLERRA